MPEAVILGSGTSTGVPVLGVRYSEEFLSNPKNHRLRPSLLLQNDGLNVLVDAGADMRVQLLREGVFDLEAVIITHTHADHVMGMDDLRCFCATTRRPMPVYCQAQDQADIKRIFDYAFREFPKGVMVPRFELRDVVGSIEVGGMQIMTFPVMHGPTKVLGLRINDFAYLTDVNFIPEESWGHLRELQTLVIDAVRVKPHPNHYHLDAALEVITRISAKQTYLTHLSHDYDHDETNSTLPEGIQLAFDGLRIAI